MNNYLKEMSSQKLLELAEIFRNSCSGLTVCNVKKDSVSSYNYIPLPVTDGPIGKNELNSLGQLLGRALIDYDIDIKSVYGITEADRGGGIILSSIQQFTGINVHWLNWYDYSTIEAFKGEFIAFDMSPMFAMGSNLRLGLYLPEELKRTLQHSGVVIVDDVISTSRTINTIKSILDSVNIPIKAIVCGVEKVDYNGRNNIKEQFDDIPVITVAKVKIRELNEEEKNFYKYNHNIIGLTELVGRDDIPYYSC